MTTVYRLIIALLIGVAVGFASDTARAQGSHTSIHNPISGGITPGGVEVKIKGPAAARWGFFNEGYWNRRSGERQEGLNPSSYKITFSAVAGFITPKPVIFKVRDNKVTRLQVVYHRAVQPQPPLKLTDIYEPGASYMRCFPTRLVARIAVHDGYSGGNGWEKVLNPNDGLTYAQRSFPYQNQEELRSAHLEVGQMVSDKITDLSRGIELYIAGERHTIIDVRIKPNLTNAVDIRYRVDEIRHEVEPGKTTTVDICNVGLVHKRYEWSSTLTSDGEGVVAESNPPRRYLKVKQESSNYFYTPFWMKEVRWLPEGNRVAFVDTTTNLSREERCKPQSGKFFPQVRQDISGILKLAKETGDATTCGLEINVPPLESVLYTIVAPMNAGGIKGIVDDDKTATTRNTNSSYPALLETDPNKFFVQVPVVREDREPFISFDSYSFALKLPWGPLEVGREKTFGFRTMFESSASKQPYHFHIEDANGRVVTSDIALINGYEATQRNANLRDYIEKDGTGRFTVFKEGEYKLRAFLIDGVVSSAEGAISVGDNNPIRRGR